MASFNLIFDRDVSSSTTHSYPTSTSLYPTNANGCFICPSTPPACPACPSGQVCNLSLQSCNECPSVQCIPANNQIFASPSSPASTSTSSSSSASSTTASSDVHNTDMMGPVIGGTVGGVLLALIAAIFIFWCIRKHRSQGNRLEINSIGEEEKSAYPISLPDVDNASPISKQLEENSFSIMHKSNCSDQTTLQKTRENTRKNLSSNGVLAISNPRILSSSYREPTVALNKSLSISNNMSANLNTMTINPELNSVEQKFQQQLQTTRDTYIKQNGRFIINPQSIRTSLSSDLYNYPIVRTSTYNQSPATPARQVIPNYTNYHRHHHSYSHGHHHNHHHHQHYDTTSGSNALSSPQNYHIRDPSESSDFSVANNPNNIIPIAYIPGVTSRPIPNTYQPIYNNTTSSINNTNTPVNIGNNQLLYSHYESSDNSFSSNSETFNYNTPYGDITLSHAGSNTSSSPSNTDRINSTTQPNSSFQMEVDSRHFDNLADNTDQVASPKI